MALGFAGYREEGIHWLRQAMRASPLDTLTWLWLNWIGDFQFFSREFGAALETFRQVICLRLAAYVAAAVVRGRSGTWGGREKPVTCFGASRQSAPSRSNAGVTGPPGTAQKIGRSGRKASGSRMPGLRKRHTPPRRDRMVADNSHQGHDRRADLQIQDTRCSPVIPQTMGWLPATVE